VTLLLEKTLPAYDFRERHSRVIAAPPEEVWRALTVVSLVDLRFGRPLVALRHLGHKADTGAKPLLTNGPIQLLETHPPHYALAGAIAQPWKRHPVHQDIETLDEFTNFTERGWTTYLTDFALVATPHGGTELSTETRGRSTSADARHRFTLYWALIRPWSGLIRRELLAAVDRIATDSNSPG
jgi:uncharacterized protein YndB with AHSA1/START domain